jgi:hypothetical protein
LPTLFLSIIAKGQQNNYINFSFLARKFPPSSLHIWVFILVFSKSSFCIFVPNSCSLFSFWSKGIQDPYSEYRQLTWQLPPDLPARACLTLFFEDFPELFENSVTYVCLSSISRFVFPFQYVGHFQGMWSFKKKIIPLQISLTCIFTNF